MGWGTETVSLKQESYLQEIVLGYILNLVDVDLDHDVNLHTSPDLLIFSLKQLDRKVSNFRPKVILNETNKEYVPWINYLAPWPVLL